MKRANRMTGALVVSMMLLSVSRGRAEDWPQWRGPNRDNKVTGFTEPKTWPKELTQKWKTKVGLGDASPMLVGDKVYVFTRDGDDEVILCLDAAKGTEIWHDKYASKPADGPGGGQHAGPRSSPAVADGKVCTFGVRGVISCLDAGTGKLAWRKDTKEAPGFYVSASPIIVEGKCILHIGKDGGMRGGEGKGAIVAYDLSSGDEKWKWSGEGPGYASPVLLTVDGAKQVVTLTEKAVVGLGVADGKLQWQVASLPPGRMLYNSITPIVDGHTVIYARENTGTTAIKIDKKDDGFASKELWKKKESAGKYNTPVLKDGLLFGLTSAGRGAARFFCMKADSGEVLWTDKTERGECGAILDAGSVLLALTSKSELVAFKPSAKEYMEVAKYKVADTPTWANPIIAGNRVFVKDRDSLTLWTIE